MPLLTRMFGYRRRPGRDPPPGAFSSSSPRPARTTRKKEKIPLAIELLKHPDSIDAQSSSPLFARLPTEMRELIWRFALTRYEDTRNLYPIASRCARPGHAAPLRVAVDLLLTCRAVYVEALVIPFQVNPMVIFDGDKLDIPPHDVLLCTPDSLRSCETLRPWQLANISSVELNVEQTMLEGGAIERASRIAGTKGRHRGYECQGFALTPGRYASFVKAGASHSVASGVSEIAGTHPSPSPLRHVFVGAAITALTVRLGRTDWWTWSTPPATERLRLEPMVDLTLHKPESMVRGYEARRAGREEPDFQLDSFERHVPWGLQFAEYWPDLRTLELVLETFAAKESQLDSVVKCAELWTFPLGDEYRLEWDGNVASTVRWQGASKYGYEHGSSWFAQQNSGQGGEDKSPALMQWRPVDETADGGGQYFVIRTLTFERRRR
ncbi:hypothetical protein F5B20DRAFT_518511 [Whalleya microplaca]|nr:hypothetical protein F5B20DRAFT_518511 [Whalleya microplaca]